MTQVLGHSESYAIPIKTIEHALERLPRASALRIMFRTLYLTGCRIAELDKMKPHLLDPPYLHWMLGKNQNRPRVMRMPEDWWRELHEYRQNEKVPGNRLFGYTSQSFVRKFNDFRPRLGPEWLDKRKFVRKDVFMTQYNLQLKGLRKTFQTLLFAEEVNHWHDPNVALEFASKHMRHSSKHITAAHYMEHFENIGIRWEDGRAVIPRRVDGQQSLLRF